MRRFKLPDKVYRRDIQLILCADQDRMNRYVKRKTGYDPKFVAGTVSARYFQHESKGWTTHYILTTDVAYTPRALAYLAHEVLHLTFSVLRDAGLAYSVKSEEAYTYYFEHMFTKAAELLRRVTSN